MSTLSMQLPVIANSHIRSVSSPVQLLSVATLSGGASECDWGLLTTAIRTPVCAAISSRRARISGFTAGFEEGRSRISERVRRIAARC